MRILKTLSICLIFMALHPLAAVAQKIDLTIPENTNMSYSFILNKGIKQDTIQSGTFNIIGSTTINIPSQHEGYTGIGMLKIKDKQSLNLIVNNENFSLTRNNNKYIFKDSPENEYLYAFLQQEPAPADGTSLYARKFVELMQYMQQLNAVASGKSQSLNDKHLVREYAINTLDVDALYTSSLWFYVLDGFLSLNPDQTAFGNDMVSILKRVKSQDVFEGLTDDLLTIMNQYGLDDAFDIIVPYIKDSGRIKTPQGQVYTAFTLAKMRKGAPAIELEGLFKPLKGSKAPYTVLYFYESDCPSCLLEMNELQKGYSELKAKNVRIISISADYDKEAYNKLAKDMPWADKLCDYTGFAGKNFLNYGIMGTPTFFLLDKEMNVISRYAKYSDIKF